MKKLLAMTIALILIFSLCAEAFADSAPKPEPVKLEGQFGEEETIRSRAPVGIATPFYLDKPVTKCKHVKLLLSVEPEYGLCGCNYYLYAKDFNEKWEHIGVFKLKENKANGKEYSYEIDLDGREDFVAVALWPADKGMSFRAYFNYSVYVDPGCITEYSDKIEEPVFEPSDVTDQYIDVTTSYDPYRNPYGAGAAAAVGALYGAIYGP